MNTDFEIGTTYIAYCRRRFLQEYFPRIEACLKELSEEDIWWRPNEESNSIGNLMLHLCGNVRRWIVCGFGDIEDTRNRPLEFSERGSLSKDQLLKKMEECLQEADSILGKFDSSRLLQKKFIQHYKITYLDALSHVVEHFAQHTAQIVYITKLRKSGAVDFFASYFSAQESSVTNEVPIR